MDTLFELLLLIFLWGNIWCVPAALAGVRRGKKKPMYIIILISVMAIELSIAAGLMQFSKLIDQINIGAYLGPAIASIMGGFLYWWLTERKDKIIANQSFKTELPQSGAP